MTFVHQVAVGLCNEVLDPLLTRSQDELFQLAVRGQQSLGGRRFKCHATLGADDRVTEVNATADSERGGHGLECFDHADGRELFAVKGHRASVLERDHVPLGCPRVGESIAREHPSLIGDAAGRRERLLAADRHAPQSSIDRVRSSGRGHGKIPLLQIVELVLPLECLVAHGREHFQVGRQGSQRHFKAHLIVACGRAAVGDHVCAQLPRHVGDGLCLHDALGADAQWIELPAAYVAHDQKAQHLVKIIGACVNLMMLDSAQRLGTLRQGPGSRGVDAAGIDRDGDDRPLVILRDPRNEK